MSRSSVPAAISSTIPLSDAPPDRTSDHAMGDNHVSTLPSQPLDTPARLNSGASLARLPSVWVDDTPTKSSIVGC